MLLKADHKIKFFIVFFIHSILVVNFYYKYYLLTFVLKIGYGEGKCNDDDG